MRESALVVVAIAACSSGAGDTRTRRDAAASPAIDAAPRQVAADAASQQVAVDVHDPWAAPDRAPVTEDPDEAPPEPEAKTARFDFEAGDKIVRVHTAAGNWRKRETASDQIELTPA
jgi:hypothetical protein